MKQYTVTRSIFFPVNTGCKINGHFFRSNRCYLGPLRPSVTAPVSTAVTAAVTAR